MTEPIGWRLADQVRRIRQERAAPHVYRLRSAIVARAEIEAARGNSSACLGPLEETPHWDDVVAVTRTVLVHDDKFATATFTRWTLCVTLPDYK